MSKDDGVTPKGSGLSPTVEPLRVSPLRASIPNADEIATIALILANGRWSAGVYHCPPAPRGKPKLWNASVVTVATCDTKEQAFRAAKAAIESGWAGTVLLHLATATPSLRFNLPTGGENALGAIASAIEARRAETQGGSVHESAVPEADAPTPSGDPS